MWKIFKSKKEENKITSIENDLCDELMDKLIDLIIDKSENINFDNIKTYKLFAEMMNDLVTFNIILNDKDLYMSLSSIRVRKISHLPDIITKDKKFVFRLDIAYVDLLNVYGNNAYYILVTLQGEIKKIL